MTNDLYIDQHSQWFHGVRRELSPNCDARPETSDIDLLVIHGISLPSGVFGGTHVTQLFCNTLDTTAHPDFASLSEVRVSAHMFVDRMGSVTQFVPLQARAWHAGESTFQGRENCNDFSIGIELEGADTIPYTVIQYRVLAGITDCLMERWPAICRSRVVGHRDVAPGRKTDPGESFSWDFYFSLCGRL